ncbi:MAG: hypothetical protein KGM47_11695 [Acidobacteriota bacterium]|nr:hypothetical protein [Acidobacteriota bacterium]
MSQQRRRNWTRAALKVIVILIVLDVVLYTLVIRPLSGLAIRQQQRFTSARIQWLVQRTTLARTEARAAALPGDRDQLQAFILRHIPPRHDGYSRAARLIQRLSEQSGVELTGIKYTLNKTQPDPLDHLGLETSAEGPFPNLLNFAHALETSGDFVVVHSFTFAAGDQGVLALHLKADLYMTP